MTDIISNIVKDIKVQIYRENCLATLLNKFLFANLTIILYIRANMMALLYESFKDSYQKISLSRYQR
jgi:hypothetical protein